MNPKTLLTGRVLSAAFASFAVSGTFASAATLTLTDAFTDGAKNGGADNSGISWWDRSVNSNLSVANDATLGGGNALIWAATNTGTTNRGIVATLSQTFTLGVGDSLSLTFDFRFAGTPILAGGSTTSPNSAAQGLTFGFYNSNGTTVAADDSTNSDNDFGYRGSVGSGTSTGNAIVQEGNNGNGGGLGTTTAGDNPNTVFSLTTSLPTAINDFNKHTGEFTITMIAPDTITITSKIDGVTIAEGSGAPGYNNFDEIVFSQAGGNSFRLDNVVVTGVVPEPSSVLTLAGGLTALCLRRRRDS